MEFSGVLQLFDYNVLTNTLTQIGNRHSIGSNAREIELTKINELSFLVSFRDYEGNIFYLKTEDGAETWSEQQYFPGISSGDRVINVTLHNGNLYAAQSENESIKIITGTSDASEWSTPSEVFLNDAPVPYASVYSNGSELFLVFEEEKYVELIDEYQTDISFLVSNDDGITWSEKINTLTLSEPICFLKLL
ncbi:MAG: hypothetical protein U5K00_17835 [Melioribacteraceae bacterium]|nr:hypothetical protein [Melioribacteraceae bacterium]